MIKPKMDNKAVFKEDDDVIEYKLKLDKPTSYSNDYRWPILDPELQEKHYVKEPKEDSEKKVESRLKIPIDFYYSPKTRLLSARETLDELKNNAEKREKVKRNRPRVYKCPEVSLDDIPDKKMRDMIIKFVYTSETQNSLEETLNALSTNMSAEFDCINVKLLLNERERLLKEMKAQKLSVGRVDMTCKEMLPPDWQLNTGKDWDHKQQKFLGQPTKNFWLQKEVHGADYDPTKIPMTPECDQYLTDLLKNDKVRFPHVYTKYGGFKPMAPHKIALEKHKSTQFDFWFTTNQSYGKHYLLDK